jgi:glycosyltransferase involved in cell wall biosynthesis
MTAQPRSRAKKAAAPLPGRRTLVIIPTFNELENLPLIVGRVHKARPDVHVLIVDDDSPDGTGRLADELALADPDRVHVMHRTVKDGLGAAYLAGFGWGLNRGYEVLVEMDADGSHAPEQLYRLLDAIESVSLDGVGVGASIGVQPMSRRPFPLTNADAALYRAKAAGGSQVARN